MGTTKIQKTNGYNAIFSATGSFFRIALTAITVCFIGLSANDAKAQRWYDVTSNALHVFDGGPVGTSFNHLVHIGRNNFVTNINTGYPTGILTFGQGVPNENYGLWSMCAEYGAFRIGRAVNMPIPATGNLHNGGRDLLTLNSYGVVGINLTNPYGANTNPISTCSWIRFRVNGCMLLEATNNFYYGSDRRYKTNIASISNLENVFKLNPVQYVPSSEGLKEKLELFKQHNKHLPEERFNTTVSSFEKQIAELDESTDLHFGFIAQDLQKLFPNLVIEDEEGFLAVNYTGLIPVLVDVIKEQQKVLEEQQRQINRILAQEKGRGIETDALFNDAILYQNNPNPFSERTEIKFYISAQSRNAFISIYDMNGREIMKLDIADRGNSSVILNGRQLQAGMYLYALIVDGKEIDTKRMILTNN